MRQGSLFGFVGKKTPPKTPIKEEKSPKKESAQPAKDNSRSPSKSTTPIKKPQSRVTAAKPTKTPTKVSKAASQSPAKESKAEVVAPPQPTTNDVEMRSQESDDEEMVAMRKRGRRNRQVMEDSDVEEEMKVEQVKPARGKKRTYSQVSKPVSQATDQQDDVPEPVSVKRGKVEERSEMTNSQQSRQKRNFSSSRLRNEQAVEQQPASYLDLGSSKAAKNEDLGSTLDLGGIKNKINRTQTGSTTAADAVTSSLDLGGGAQSKPATRQTRRNRDPSPEQVDEDNEEDEKPQVLDGFTIVVSGVFENITREKLEALISTYGGRVTGSVSGKTDYLVVGYKIEDGREVHLGGKYKAAKSKGKPILTEDDFQNLMREKLDDSSYTLSAPLPEMLASPLRQEVSSTPIDKSKNDMWTDRYKPRGFQDLVGNQGAISQLYEWLKDWDDVCIRGNKKPLPIRRGMSWQDVQNINARAALISGPPGIGKTSAARIVCAQLGYAVCEQNASDVRNKGAIEHAIKDLSNNKSLDYFSVSGVKKAAENDNPMAAAVGGFATQKSVIIMDEVDGVGAGDRGGIAALIKVIKNSKTPIICICNDRQSQKLASLVNHCFDLKFQRPQSAHISQMVMKVAKNENIDLDEETCANLIEMSGNDIRQVINILQLWTQQTASGSEDSAKKFLAAGGKDEKVMINNFEAAYRLLNHGAVSLDKKYPRFQQKIDLFFIDHDWVPLLVQESYLNGMGQRKELEDIEQMAMASEFISLGDCINRQIRTNMQWTLLPQLGTCGAVAPCLLTKGRSMYPRFPEWLGKNSSQRKSFRQIRELKAAMGMQAQANKRAVQLEYVPVILSMLYKHMSKGNAEDAIDLLSDFRITNDMFKEHLLDLCMNRKAQEAFDKLSTVQKSAFTRAYNKVNKDPTQGKRGKKTSAKDDDAVSESDDEKDQDKNLDEDELAEIKRAKQRERDRLMDKEATKVEKFEMIKPVIKGEATKSAAAAAKKGKAKTQQAKKKGGGKKGKGTDDDESLDGFVVADDDEDAVKPRAKRGKAKTAKGKKK